MKTYKHILLNLTAISAMAAPIFFSSCGGSTTEKGHESDTTGVKPIQEEEIVKIETLTITKVEYDQPTLNENSGTYSLNVKATVDGPGKEKAVVVYTLTKVAADNSETKTASNEDGEFNDISGLKDREIYIMIASIKGSPDTKNEIRLFSENMPIVEKVQKLSAEELTSIIMSYANGDNTTYEAKKDCIANDCKYSASDGSVFYLGEIIEALGFGDWESIEFSSVEYDTFNRISKATFKINYPN